MLKIAFLCSDITRNDEGNRDMYLHRVPLPKKETLMDEEIQLNTEVKLCWPQVQTQMWDKHSNEPKLDFKIPELSCFQLNPDLFAVTIGLAGLTVGKEEWYFHSHASCLCRSVCWVAGELGLMVLDDWKNLDILCLVGFYSLDHLME